MRMLSTDFINSQLGKFMRIKYYLVYSIALLLTILIQSKLLSQIVIDNSGINNYYGAGVVWHQYSNSNPNITMNIGVSSSTQAQSWTVPNFTVTDSVITNYIDPSSSPYISRFPGSTYASVINGSQSGLKFESYQYIKLSNDTLYVIGTVQHYYGTLNNQPIDTVLVKDTTFIGTVLPAQLGASYYSTPDTISLGSGSFQVVARQNVFDAYGTVTFSFGTFQAIRLKETEFYMDYSGSTLTDSFKEYNYTWLTSEGHTFKVDVSRDSSSGNVLLTEIEINYSGAAATAVESYNELSAGYVLSQNYPNPFNPSTTINYQIPQSSFVSLKVFDVLGREVASLVNKQQSQGNYTVNFNASNLPSGVYIYKITAGNFVQTKKLMLLK